ncbi:hypothetical protein niasHT_008333 [Heterodera trifolii]|uniref:Peptidase metallopeptidase domain-containing protein n=1 Tax=Heterodera trifolii TaxID=157864 RepID=A0ABD2M1H2_9BILA
MCTVLSTRKEETEEEETGPAKFKQMDQISNRYSFQQNMDKTCITFTTDLSQGPDEGIEIYDKKDKVCGRSPFGHINQWQRVSISCTDSYTVAHEFLHALALWHEQDRDDANKYIKLNPTPRNPKDGKKVITKLKWLNEKVLSCGDPCGTFRVEITYRKDKRARGAFICCSAQIEQDETKNWIEADAPDEDIHISAYINSSNFQQFTELFELTYETGMGT